MECEKGILGEVMKKMSQKSMDEKRLKEEKKKKGKERRNVGCLIKSGVLDFRDLGLEGIERLCRADLTWELVPLYYCHGIVYQYPFANTYSHQWRQDDCKG